MGEREARDELVSDRCGQGLEQSIRVAEEPSERALAREADEHRKAEPGDLLEPPKQLDVVLQGLPEAKAGVDEDPLLRDPGRNREGDALLEESANVADDV